MNAPGINAVLLDLDGTLVDTAPDMGAALNELLSDYDLSPVDYETYRSRVSHGAKGLIDLGFGTEFAEQNFTTLRHRFLQLYAQRLCRETRVFDGFLQVLDILEARGVPWGIVTNKPAGLTEPLVEQLQAAGEKFFPTKEAGATLNLEVTPQIISRSMDRIVYSTGIDPAVVQQTIDYMVELGYIKGEVKAADILDLRYLYGE